MAAGADRHAVDTDCLGRRQLIDFNKTGKEFREGAAAFSILVDVSHRNEDTLFIGFGVDGKCTAFCSLNPKPPYSCIASASTLTDLTGG